ncbi:MAG: two-component system sensor histidine kinase [Bacteroidetes bacterium HLUCCA01]|nr:MAG: two-component system sensor histidine kinase [Bacteroidetes bacterium HLUCCA01]
MRVLLVDTCPLDADRARSALRDVPDLQVDYVDDYQNALLLISKYAYAAVICDIVLGSYHASDLLREVKKLGIETEFVLLSSRLEEADGVDYLELGAFDYVHKESVQKLPYVIRHVIKESQQTVQNRLMGISMHDIMSPITAITGYLDLMRNQLAGDEKVNRTIYDYSRKIRNGVSDISSILEQMRTTAPERLREPEEQHQDEEAMLCLDVDLNWVAQEVCDIMQGAVKSRNHSLKFSPSQQPVYVSVDIQHLKRILYNFISNAIRYTPEGGFIQVEVGKNNQRAFMAVTDNGIGIPAEKHEQIFRMNSKLQKFDLYNKKSTGLGLYVNASLARQLGGEIKLNSAPGKGSTFKLELPTQNSMQQAG